MSSAIRNKNSVIISKQKSAQGFSRAHVHSRISPRSAVFSGVPPPDLQTLNMQKTLDEYKIQVSELHDKLDACHNEIARLRATQARVKVPDPPDFVLNSNVFDEHLEFMNDVENEMQNRATTLSTYNKTLQILCQELQSKLSQQSQQLLKSTGDIDLWKRKYHNLEQSLNQTPRVTEGVVKIQPPRVVGRQFDPTTKTIGVQTDFVSQTLSVNTSVGERSTPPSSPGNNHSQEIPIPTKELLDKLLLSLKVNGNPASVSYVKSIRMLLRKYSIVDTVPDDQPNSGFYASPNPTISRSSRSPLNLDRRKITKTATNGPVGRRRTSPTSYVRSSTQYSRGSSPVLICTRTRSKSPSTSA
eukprot:TRINITY_DN7977_c0_g1_i1.p1 TRINITY_DN7977_c0_g1~~TRINITY_DN7977_c0_g1_i1.p1  ORF type:complete len:357 (+),score=59.70 TRINITY_DN7977_c0_g1_i1:78-1148(+)